MPGPHPHWAPRPLFKHGSGPKPKVRKCQVRRTLGKSDRKIKDRTSECGDFAPWCIS